MQSWSQCFTEAVRQDCMDFGNIGSMIESFTYLDSIWLKVWLVAEHIVFFPLKLGGISFLKFGQRGGSLKNCSEIGGLVERGGGGFPNCFISFP